MRLLIVLVVFAAGCVAPSAESTTAPESTTTATTVPVTYAISGELALVISREQSDKYWLPCKGKGGYGDITPSAQVTVSDEAGVLLAVGKLEEGRVDRSSSSCVLPFVVEGLPEVKIYRIQVSRRGELAYSFEDLSDRGWFVSMRLGG